MDTQKQTTRLLDAVLFREIWKAMKVTFKHMFHRPMTFQYPREKRTIPDAHRGALGLLRYDNGQERCVGCDLCEAACPSRCIKVISEEDKSLPLQRYATEFYIDITKCVFCGYCVEACPVNALAMTKMYEYSTHDKRTLMFDKQRLYEIGEKHLEDAKKYLYAHNQEQDEEESRACREPF
ncbi:MAG: NADH-quinone oxidoreductase subunit NuoI, partial [Nitrospira sp. SB0673_bin_12]|nr:NADH-quinone oxidoreductase subunit NuoI [Nitrospira sp. SB0673_bin_12]